MTNFLRFAGEVGYYRDVPNAYAAACGAAGAARPVGEPGPAGTAGGRERVRVRGE